eukprot:TRINITY_DN17953_c0_g1_i1.p1 TRINITY_DN17953_c0_g1~~TRINITY_DN17953_c0_g1_i1.p1  ORF type:complete len:662 (-),score=217.24 TRINITY_DN17953_c0_g1_i1:46-2031(-)
MCIRDSHTDSTDFGPAIPQSLRMCLRRFSWQAIPEDPTELAQGVRLLAARTLAEQHSQGSIGSRKGGSALLQFMSPSPHSKVRRGVASKAVFISYAHQDSAQVLPLWRELEAEGIDCWIDILQRQSASSNWREETSIAIQECAVVLCVCSAASVHSLYCQEEWQHGADQHKQLVSIWFNKQTQGGPEAPAATCVLQERAGWEASVVAVVMELKYRLATAAAPPLHSTEAREQQIARCFGALTGRRWQELDTLLQQLCHPQVRVSVAGVESEGVPALAAALRQVLGEPCFELHVLAVERRGGTEAAPELQVLWELRGAATDGSLLARVNSGRSGSALAFDGISSCVFRHDKLMEMRLHTGSSSTTTQQGEQRIEWVRGNLIGSGAFGNVFAGLTIPHNELVAVKEINIVDSSSQDGQFAAALQNEVSVLASLGAHQHIVKYKGCQIDTPQDGHSRQSSLLIFLEYVPGGSLASLIQRFGALREGTVQQYTRQVLLGVEFLLSLGVAHRDIKGANILVTLDGCLKLSDFGCSKTEQGGGGFTTMTGTPFWMAPEVVRGEGYGRAADIWSVGCVVVEMCTGSPPWTHLTNPFAIMYQIGHAKAPPDIPACLGEQGRALLGRCFVLKPEERPDASRLLAEAPFLALQSPLEQSKPLAEPEQKPLE